VLIEPYWAHAWNRVLRGESPPPPPATAPKRRGQTLDASQGPVSAWALLGLEPGANLIELKRAFRARALETHPDRGGDAAQFRAVQRAYERLLQRLLRGARRPLRRG
jgi:hypothetical protein